MRHVVAVYIPHCSNPFEAAVACEAFGLDRPELGVEWYDFRLCADGRRVRTSTGMTWHTDYDLDVLANADTIVIPAEPNLRHRQPDPARDTVVEALRTAYDNGARLLSFCTGAFTLARTGLLDGKQATTHWMYATPFREQFPNVQLQPNVLFVDQGRIFTSAGSAAGIDLSLHIIRADYGAQIARDVAKRMVVPPFRQGGQAQFIDPPHQPIVADDLLGDTMDWALTQLHTELTVTDMAGNAVMSERTFARRFRERTGTTPLKWLTTQRVKYAQELLETTDLSVEQIAFRAGMGSAANLREHFRRELGTPPSNYRKMFAGTT